MPSVRPVDAAQATPQTGGPGHPPAQWAGPSAAGQGEGGPLSVTSHTLSLSTRAFSVDFSWSRVEADPPTGQRAASPAPAAPAEPKQPAATRPQRPLQSFSEILRRQQLAQLLVVVPPTPRDAVLLWEAEAPASTQAGPVCRAYSQAQGPLAQSSRLFRV